MYASAVLYSDYRIELDRSYTIDNIRIKDQSI